MLLSISHHWNDIGLLLIPKLPKGTLERINKQNPNDLVGCVREMLTTWEKQIDPCRPTWSALATAVEPFDTDKADEIRRKYCTEIHV